MLVGKYCGFETPDDVSSPTNQMKIKFTTDSRNNGHGFSANFAASKYHLYGRSIMVDLYGGFLMV